MTPIQGTPAPVGGLALLPGVAMAALLGGRGLDGAQGGPRSDR